MNEHHVASEETGALPIERRERHNWRGVPGARVVEWRAACPCGAEVVGSSRVEDGRVVCRCGVLYACGDAGARVVPATPLRPVSGGPATRRYFLDAAGRAYVVEYRDPPSVEEILARSPPPAKPEADQ